MATALIGGGSGASIITLSGPTTQFIVVNPRIQTPFKRVRAMDMLINNDNVASLSTLSVGIYALPTPPGSIAEMQASGIPLYKEVVLTNGGAVPTGVLNVTFPLFYTLQTNLPYLGIALTENSACAWRGFAGFRYDF